MPNIALAEYRAPENDRASDCPLCADTVSLQDTPSSIEYLDFATGKATPLHTLSKPVDLGLALSPDGRYLLFAQNDLSGSDLMLVENFR